MNNQKYIDIGKYIATVIFAVGVTYATLFQRIRILERDVERLRETQLVLISKADADRAIVLEMKVDLRYIRFSLDEFREKLP